MNTKRIRTVLLAVGLVAILALASVGGALAQGGPPTSTPGAHPAELKVQGTITALNTTAATPTVTITPKEGLPVTLKVVASTKITKAGVGAKASLNNIAIGDRVSAAYSGDSLEASRLNVSAPVGKHHGYKGTIKSITPTGFTVTTKKDSDVAFTINEDTKYKVPGVKDATLANFKLGDQVAVGAVEVSGANAALHVNLIPAKPASVHRVGTVTSYVAGSSIVVKDKKDATSTFVVNAETKIELKKGATGVTVGSRVTVVAKRDPATDQFTAKAILVFGSEGKP